eukprot:CAMPEP_0119544400 /NCGR_PEP_ID=MMETSP1344-20130328/54710_1 /TAXON_ID=236787 /ORGANISM="Florenciella parvula, Strain CCMP2471" /LENGTH=752 /DNA_ID=CAMNT_0007588899 /DNA_START=82 /DNA_END=2337 /DNA_ORIENTATION=-
MAAVWDDQYGDYDDDGAWGDAGAGQWECNLCKFKNSPFMPVCEICSLKKDAPAPEASLHYGGADTTHGVRPILLGEGVLSQHQAAYRGHPHIYEGEVRKLLDLAVAIPSANLPRIAATLAAEKSHDLVRALLDHMSIAEVLAFTKFLDGPRKVRQWTKKLERLSADPNRPVKASTIAAIEKKIAVVNQEVLEGGNVTGALAKKIRAKVKTELPAEKLEFYLLMFPTGVWKELADLVHFAPGDFQLDYFLSVVYDTPAPPGSLVADVRALAETPEGAAAVAPLLQKHDNLFLDYSYLRKKFPPDSANELPGEVKLMIARKAPLEDVIWFYEELEAEGVEAALHHRLASGESLEAGRGRANFGKLMERLILFRNRGLKFVPALLRYADDQLAVIMAGGRAAAAANSTAVNSNSTAANSAGKAAAEEPVAVAVAAAGGHGGRVAVLGDASGSMEVAINTATILGSLLSVCLNADLRFFNDGSFPPPTMPTKAAEVLTVTEQVPATGLTSPAVALTPFFAEAKAGTEPPVDLFIVVSDEEENTPDPTSGMTFAQRFRQYQQEVNANAKCFLVSFLTGPSSFLGKMNASLRSEGIMCRQFRLDARRPDLSKLTSLLALLKLELHSGMHLSEAVQDAEAAAAEVATAAEVAVADLPPPPAVGSGGDEGGAGGGALAEAAVVAEPAPAEVGEAAAHAHAQAEVVVTLTAQAEVVCEADEIARLKAELEAAKAEAAKAKAEAAAAKANATWAKAAGERGG